MRLLYSRKCVNLILLERGVTMRERFVLERQSGFSGNGERKLSRQDLILGLLSIDQVRALALVFYGISKARR